MARVRLQRPGGAGLWDALQQQQGYCPGRKLCNPEGLKPLRIVLSVLTMRLAQLALPGSFVLYLSQYNLWIRTKN